MRKRGIEIKKERESNRDKEKERVKKSGIQMNRKREGG